MVEWVAQNWLAVSVIVFFVITLFGFLVTMSSGYGPYNTSTLIVILVLFVASVGSSTDKLTGDDLSKLLFALVGFAAGLFTGSSANDTSKNAAKTEGRPDKHQSTENEVG